MEKWEYCTLEWLWDKSFIRLNLTRWARGEVYGQLPRSDHNADDPRRGWLGGRHMCDSQQLAFLDAQAAGVIANLFRSLSYSDHDR